jgi:hypothetical protein
VNHLYTPEGQGDAAIRWNDETTRLLTELLLDMGKSLGYHFDRVTLMRNVYFPVGWNSTEVEQRQLRQAAVKVFEGEKTLKVELVNEAAVPDAPIAPRPILPR